MSEQNIGYVQYGAQLSMNGLSEETKEEIIETIQESGLQVGKAPGDEEYLVNTSEEEQTMSEQNLAYIQYGAQLSMNGLDEETEEEIIEAIQESGLQVGNNLGDGEYLVNTSEEE